MTVSFFIAAVGFLTGFLLGKWYYKKPEQEKQEEEEEKAELIGSVASPVNGEIDGEKAEEGVVVIRPSEGKVYAPVSGKVVRLFPMGNELLLRTEFGAEIHLQAGGGKDELLGEYYSPRVVQNEIVGKGKLLLEFDKKGLEAEGASVDISLSLSEEQGGTRVYRKGDGRVKTGEEILQIRGDFQSAGIPWD